MNTPSGNNENSIQIFALAGNMIVSCLFLYYFLKHRYLQLFKLKFQYTTINYTTVNNEFN